MIFRMVFRIKTKKTLQIQYNIKDHGRYSSELTCQGDISER